MGPGLIDFSRFFLRGCYLEFESKIAAVLKRDEFAKDVRVVVQEIFLHKDVRNFKDDLAFAEGYELDRIDPVVEFCASAFGFRKFKKLKPSVF